MSMKMRLVGAVLLLFASADARKPPSPQLHRQQLHIHHTVGSEALVAARGEQKEPWSAERVHDLFNVAFTSSMAALTVSAFSKPAYNKVLAVIMCIYLVLDGLWLVLDPEGVSGGTDGGGARALLGHHALALLVSLHAATHEPHRRYTSWVTVVEINTLILMLKKNITKPAPLNKALNLLFLSTWIISRLIWFPLLSIYIAFLPGYPGLIQQLVVGFAMFGLTALQYIWTYNFFVPPERQIPV